jgi:hypothetical protein
MHTESPAHHRSSLGFALRIFIAGLLSLFLLAMELPIVSRAHNWSIVATIAACIFPLALIASGVLSRRRGLEIAGWLALLAVFLLWFFV